MKDMVQKNEGKKIDRGKENVGKKMKDRGQESEGQGARK